MDIFYLMKNLKIIISLGTILVFFGVYLAKKKNVKKI